MINASICIGMSEEKHVGGRRVAALKDGYGRRLGYSCN